MFLSYHFSFHVISGYVSPRAIPFPSQCVSCPVRRPFLCVMPLTTISFWNERVWKHSTKERENRKRFNCFPATWVLSQQRAGKLSPLQPPARAPELRGWVRGGGGALLSLLASGRCVRKKITERKRETSMSSRPRAKCTPLSARLLAGTEVASRARGLVTTPGRTLWHWGAMVSCVGVQNAFREFGCFYWGLIGHALHVNTLSLFNNTIVSDSQDLR